MKQNHNDDMPTHIRASKLTGILGDINQNGIISQSYLFIIIQTLSQISFTVFHEVTFLNERSGTETKKRNKNIEHVNITH